MDIFLLMSFHPLGEIVEIVGINDTIPTKNG